MISPLFHLLCPRLSSFLFLSAALAICRLFWPFLFNSIQVEQFISCGSALTCCQDCTPDYVGGLLAFLALFIFLQFDKKRPWAIVIGQLACKCVTFFSRKCSSCSLMFLMLLQGFSGWCLDLKYWILFKFLIFMAFILLLYPGFLMCARFNPLLLLPAVNLHILSLIHFVQFVFVHSKFNLRFISLQIFLLNLSYKCNWHLCSGTKFESISLKGVCF